MCGLFGFVGVPDDDPLAESNRCRHLARIAELAGTRGPHAHGVAWWEDPDWRVLRRPGSSIGRSLPWTAPMMIGHSRLSTTHNPFVVDEAQPLQRDGLTLAHNGTVRHLHELDWAGPRMTTGTDSEALLIAAADAAADGVPFDGLLEAAVDRCRLDSPYALLLASAEGVCARRNGQPLFVRNDRHGVWLCSRTGAAFTAIPPAVTLHFAPPT